MELRLARTTDAEAIRAIYNKEVSGSTSTFDLVERSPESQEEWMASRSGVFTVIVAELEEQILGFASLSPFKERAAYRTSVENSIYVAENHRRKGIGDALLAELLRIARNSGFHCVIARIGGDNKTSVALHAKHGFRLVGIEREVGRKFGRWQDVTVMQTLLG